MNVALAHDHVANVDADAEAKLPLGWAGLIALMKGVLDFHRTLHRGECAGKLEEKTIAGSFHFPPAVAGQDAAHDPPVLLEHLEGERFAALRERAVAHHVCEHDGSELALLGVGAHGSVNPTFRINGAKRGSE